MVRRGTATRAGKAVWTLVTIGGYVSTAGSFADANLPVWIVALVWGAVWIAGVVAIQWWESRVWFDLASDVGFDIADEWTPYSILWAQRPSLEGTVGGRRVTVGTRIDRSGSSWAQPRTVVAVEADADVRFALVPDSRFGPDLGGDVEVGDDAFNRRFQVVAGGSTAIAADATSIVGVESPGKVEGAGKVDPPDADRVRASLPPAIREELLSLPAGSVEVNQDRVVFDAEGKLLESDRLLRVVEAMVELAGHVEE